MINNTTHYLLMCTTSTLLCCQVTLSFTVDTWLIWMQTKLRPCQSTEGNRPGQPRPTWLNNITNNFTSLRQQEQVINRNEHSGGC